MPRALTQQEVSSFRDDLCAAASRLFAERGFEGVTLRALASELGCSPMTPYRYFGGKEEILRAVRVAGFEEFGRRLGEAAARETDPVARFRAMAYAYVAFAREEPHLYRNMFQMVGGPPNDDEASALGQATWTPLLDTIGELIDRGVVTGDPNTLGHVCWIMLHGAVTLHLSEKLMFGISLDELIEPVLSTFFHGSPARPIAEV